MPIKSTVSLSRAASFIVEYRSRSTRSLRCVDLLSQLFNNNTPPPPQSEDQEPTHRSSSGIGNHKDKQAEAAALKMERIQLPSPIFSFQTTASAPNDPRKVDCFPLADGKMLWADQFGRTYLYYAGYRRFLFMPHLHRPKDTPVSLFIPSAYEDNKCGYGCKLFVMERFPKQETIHSTGRSYQFEAFSQIEPNMLPCLAWQWELLPPPPFFHEPAYWNICPGISSYAIFGDGKHICISVDGWGTYCLDTENYTWSDLGKWTLPFHGKVEYVPELKLWFGLSAKDHQLAAADLSNMDSQPQLLITSKQPEMPEEWKEYKDPQLVNLGFGRFCIARFLRTTTHRGETGDYSDQYHAVFTGVEVLPPTCLSKEVEPQMITRKSICHSSSGLSIDAVF